MIKLSQRLGNIAEEIETGETVADIGTDHGFLPIHLYERGISPKVILTDISKPSLEKAVEDCNMYCPHGNFDFRHGSGIEVLSEGEVDTVVIAGMGGILMTEILGRDLNKTYSFKKLILQPRTHIGRLRYWLVKNGFTVSGERLVREGKRICEILTVIPAERCFDRRTDEDDIEYELPFSWLYCSEPLLEEYATLKLNKEREKLKRKSISSKTTFKELRTQKHRVEYLEYFMRKIDESR